MKKLLSVLCALCVVLSSASCAESEVGTLEPASPQVTGGPATTDIFTISDPSADTTTSALFTTSATSGSSDDNSIVSETTQGMSEITTLPPETTTEQQNTEVISEAFVPAYDPGMPDVWLDVQPREIYEDTKQITVSINCSVESEISGTVVIQRRTDSGWTEVASLIADCSGTITPESPFVFNIYPDEIESFEAGDEYRISTKANGKEYEVFFGVGAHIPPLKNEDIQVYMPNAFIIGETESFNIDYTYVGGAEHAEYGFGCYYTLEKRNDKGEWEEVPFSEDAAFIDLGYLISYDYPKNSTSVSLRDDFYAEPLTAGTYRVVKPIEGDVTLTCLFRLNESYPNYGPEPTEKDIKITIDQLLNGEAITAETPQIDLTFEYTGEDDFAEFTFGHEYRLEKFAADDGEWEQVPFSEIGWDDIGLIVGSENPKQHDTVYLDDKYYTEPVTDGMYRIVKEISGKEFYAEFTVGDPEFIPHSLDVGFTVKGADWFEVDNESKQLTLSYTYTTDNLHIYSDFRLQKRGKDGKWQEVPFAEGMGFDDYVIILDKDNPYAEETITLSDSMFKEPLETGTYRLLKDLCDCHTATAVFFIHKNGGMPYPAPDDIEMKVKPYKEGEEITPENDKVIVDFVYTGGDYYANYEMHDRFSLQRLENGEWVDMKPVKEDDDLASDNSTNPIGTDVPENCTTVTLSRLTSEEIKAGSYRLVMKLGSLYETAEFEVQEAETLYGIYDENGDITLTINEITDDGFVCSLPWPYPATYTVECNPDEYDNFCVGDNIEVSYSVIYERGKWDFLVIPTSVSMSDFELQEGVDYKPVIYLYPEEETEVSVNLDYNGELTVTYPEYNDGWNVTAMPDGTLYDKDGNQYNYLFWEGKSNTVYDFSKGFCIKREDSAEFLRWALTKLGLTPREYNEFIVFWLPFMLKNEYNVISFQYDCYTDNAVLSVTPEPDTVIRVFMAFYGSNVPVEIEEQELSAPEREGFTVVEWGGTITG